VHYQSALPQPQKLNIIYNERLRITEKCSSIDSLHQHYIKFDTVLMENGYPRNIIQRSYIPRRPHMRRIPPKDYFYIKIPFKNEGIQVRFYYNKSLLTKRSTPIICTSNICQFMDCGFCHLNNAVYQVSCTTCHKIYIGSTIRTLHSRLNEHARNTESSIYKHLQVCSPSLPIDQKLRITILTRENDNINLRIKEAIFIKEKKPELNSREELRELQMLLQRQ